MSREETRKQADVMIGFANGETIQFRRRHCRPGSDCVDKRWGDHPDPSWDWGNFEYRIKPEPMEIEVWVNPSDRVARIFLAEDIRNTMAVPSLHGYTKKKFREVLDE